MLTEDATYSMPFECCSLKAEEKHTFVVGGLLCFCLAKVDLQAFTKMKCYATVLPNVPIEISSLSIFDAG